MYSDFDQFYLAQQRNNCRGLVVVSGESIDCERSVLQLAVRLAQGLPEQSHAKGDKSGGLTARADEASESSALQQAATLLWIADDLPQNYSSGDNSYSESLVMRHVHRAKAKQLLGSDIGDVVVNAHHGLDLNTLGVISGALRGGHLLFLLTPTLENWAEFDDPEYQRYSNFIASSDWQGAESDTPPAGMFGGVNARLARIFTEMSGSADADFASCTYVVAAHDVLSVSNENNGIDKSHKVINSGALVACDKTVRLASDQLDVVSIEKPNTQQAVAISNVQSLAGADNGCVLLTADRGRGKSWALGVAAANWLNAQAARTVDADSHQSNLKNILICAPHRKAVDTLFDRARRTIVDKAQLQRLQFIAVDALLALVDGVDADSSRNEGSTSHRSVGLLSNSYALCVIDEAAALPLALLQRIAGSFPRTVFSSTTFGYEGSGRGFLLRFVNYLQQSEPNFVHCQLSQPIRWSECDQFERLMAWLLLIGDSHTPSQHVSATRVGEELSLDLRYRRVSAQQLLDNEALLQQVFRLLIDAHYQTSPNDLRYLLDTPYTHIWLAEHHTQLTSDAGDSDDAAQSLVDRATLCGVLLVCEEGGMSNADDLIADIARGKRRPRGNMLAQLLTYHTREADWCLRRGWRVMRIVVDTAWRRSGVGSSLVAAMEADARAARCDYWGSVFGFDLGNVAFWQALQTTPVHLGLHRDKSSGARNLAIVKLLAPSQLASAQGLMFSAARLQAMLGANLRELQHYFCREFGEADIAALNDWLDQRFIAFDSPAQLPAFDLLAYDRATINRFIDGEYALEAVFIALKRQWLNGERSERQRESQRHEHGKAFKPALSDSAAYEAFVDAFIAQAPHWESLAKQYRLGGRGGITKHLRDALKKLGLA